MSKHATAGTSGSACETASKAASDLGLMKRSQLAECAQGRDDVLIDANRFGEAIPPVNDP